MHEAGRRRRDPGNSLAKLAARLAGTARRCNWRGGVAVPADSRHPQPAGAQREVSAAQPALRKFPPNLPRSSVFLLNRTQTRVAELYLGLMLGMMRFGLARSEWCAARQSNRVFIVITEIIVLAMIAAFLGLRLYSVLGRRAEHEEESVPQRFEPGESNGQNGAPAQPQATTSASPAIRPMQLEGVMPAVERGIREIAAADSRFDLAAFLEGARSAYEMVLEAFWNGDKDTLRELCDDDVYEGFSNAIDARLEAGETLENSLIRIEETRIHSASLDGRIARIAVLFVADIAAVTRDAEGVVVAGSLDDAIESRDVWTFTRNVGARDPNWLLDETDEG